MENNFDPHSLSSFLCMNQLDDIRIHQFELLRGITVPGDLITNLENLKNRKFSFLTDSHHDKLLDFIQYCLRNNITLEYAGQNDFNIWKKGYKRMIKNVQNHIFVKTLGDLGVSSTQICFLRERFEVKSFDDLMENRLEFKPQEIQGLESKSHSVCLMILAYGRDRVSQGNDEPFDRFNLGEFLLWSFFFNGKHGRQVIYTPEGYYSGNYTPAPAIEDLDSDAGSTAIHGAYWQRNLDTAFESVVSISEDPHDSNNNSVSGKSRKRSASLKEEQSE